MDDRGTSKGRRQVQDDARDTAPAVTQSASGRTEGSVAGPSATKALLSSVFRVAPVGIGLVIDRRILQANERFCEMVGYTPDELIGQNALRLYPDQAEYERVGREKYRQISEHGTGTIETQLRRKDGTVIDVLLSSTPLDLNDLSKGVTFTALDITARKQVEEELQSLFDLSLDMVCIADIHTATFVKVNPAFERTLGYPRESFEGQSFLDFIHPDDLEQTRTVIEKKLLKGTAVINFQNRYRCKDGSYRWLGWTSHPRPERGLTYAIARDITEQKRHDLALKANEEQYRSLFEGANDGIFILQDGRFIECNSKILHMFECARGQIIGRSPEEVSPPIQPNGRESNVAAAEYIAAALDGAPQQVEWRHRKMDGTLFDVEVSLNAVRLPTGDLVQAIVRDVTERKRADETLRESQAILNETGMIARTGGWKHNLITGEAVWTQALYDVIEIAPDTPPPGVDEHLSYYPPDQRRILEEAYRRAVETGEPFDLELEVTTAKGRLIWCRVLGRPTMRDGVCVEMRGTFQDISDRKQAEEALRQRAEKYRRMEANIPGMVYEFAMRPDGKPAFLYATEEVRELFGIEPEDLVRDESLLSDHIHPDDRARRDESFAESLRTLRPWRQELRHIIDGEVRWYDCMSRPERLSDGTILWDGIIIETTDRKRAEEALQRERDRAQTYLDVAGVMFIALDQSGRVSLVNRKGCEVLGYCENEILGVDWFANFVPEHMRRDVWEIFDRLLKGQTHLREYAETPVLVRGGSERLVAWHNTVLTDETGAIIGTLSSGEDITERKRAEAERERLTRIIEATSDLVSMCNAEQQITYANRAGKEIFGWPVDEDMPPKRIQDVHPQWAYYIVEEEGLPEAIEHGIWSGETAVLRSDGTEIPISQVIMSHKSEDGRLDYFSTIMRDLTERKRIEAALRMFEFTTEQAPDSIFWLERNGRFRYVNDKACESLGYSREELTNLYVWDIDPLFPKERMEEEWKHYQKGEIGTLRLEVAHRRKDGTEFPIEVSSRHFWFGDTEFHVAYARDITERRQAEQKIREQRETEKQRIETELAKVRDELIRKTRLAALGQVSGSIAHDLRNPLGAVRNASYLLKRRLPKDQPALLDHLAIIEQEVIKADRIITSLLNITRARSPEKQSVDVGALVQAAWNRGLYPQEVQLQIELSEEPFVVQADQDQLSQVLSNLLNNAVDAVGGEGQCIVQARHESQFDVMIVRDTGPGWPEEAREKLFEPLVTTKVSGTGLGLTICRQIIESHGGQIEAVDGDPQGAAVYIRLPRS